MTIRVALRRTRFVSVLLVGICMAGCSDTSKQQGSRNSVRIPIDYSSPATVLAGIGRIIEHKREDLLPSVYTPESVKAIRHNNQTGIGTAGTVDGLIREEIAIHIARTSPPGTPKRTPVPKRRIGKPGKKNPAPAKRPTPVKKTPFSPPLLLNSNAGRLTIRWPSGTVSPVLFVKRGTRWLVDVLNGPGGTILLLKE